jgi:hypothetical protein
MILMEISAFGGKQSTWTEDERDKKLKTKTAPEFDFRGSHDGIR